MANVDWSNVDWANAEKIKSIPFGEYLNTGDLSKSLSSVLGEQDESFDGLDNFFKTAKKHGIKLDSNAISNFALVNAIKGPKTPGYADKGGFKEQLGDVEAMQKRQADYRQELGRQSSGQALLMNSIGKLGSTLSTALGGPSWDTIERNRQSGLTAINSINPSTIQPLSIAQFQSRPYYS
jgi:hypothetical protein